MGNITWWINLRDMIEGKKLKCHLKLYAGLEKLSMSLICISLALDSHYDSLGEAWTHLQNTNGWNNSNNQPDHMGICKYFT